MNSLSVITGGLSGYAAQRQQPIPTTLQATMFGSLTALHYLRILAEHTPLTGRAAAAGLLITPLVIAVQFGIGYGMGTMAYIAKGDPIKTA